MFKLVLKIAGSILLLAALLAVGAYLLLITAVNENAKPDETKLDKSVIANPYYSEIRFHEIYIN